MGSLLIRDIHTLVTMDDRRSILEGAWLYALDGEIREVGRGAPPRRKADRTLRASHLLAVPGLINTHHHLYQTLTRALPAAADVPLFPWLVTLYPLWARLDEEAVYTAALVGLAELMLSGCTTAADHHYVFPRGQTRLIDAEIAAAARLGVRFHPCRGSMSLSVKDGGLPPDSVVQSEDEILADCERVIRKYHDPRPGGMVRIALAPCSPFSVTKRLMVLMAELARQRGVRLHTHLAETREEEDYCRARYRQRPVDLLEETGWLHSRTWIAHGIHLNAFERKRLGRAGVGVAHCPTSNMRLGSGIAPVIDLRRNGCPVGLGVDGSASNDGSHLLAEARQALLLARVAHGAAAMTVREALEMATRDGARCLGRDDIGTIHPGKRADIALFDLRALEYSGAGAPLPALLLCAPTRVHTLVVEGRVVVEGGELCALRLEPVLRAHRRLAARLRRG
jgi:cytosine/adenosine deaminase-related metal-dependent hydrolase